MDEVNETGEEILITKRGRPVARLVRPNKPELQLWGSCRDLGRIVGDVMEPVAPIEDWEAHRDPNNVLDPEGGENR